MLCILSSKTTDVQANYPWWALPCPSRLAGAYRGLAAGGRQAGGSQAADRWPDLHAPELTSSLAGRIFSEIL